MNKTKWIYWIATGLLCLGYLAGAVMYTFAHDMVADMFPKLGYPVYLTYLLPIVKVLGPVAILSRYSVALSDLAYAGMFFHLPLAFSAHVTSGQPGWQPAVIMFVLLLVSFFTQNAARKPQSPYAGTRFGAAS
ncbi:DoxX family protein [Aestuariivirga litoralis]|uniref:DoxX family protein n=1 Tax=Aestuariivirga litoralis TaxID=2650924 RepID=UPI0018C4C371|nr:DoxX family protein [Aestuariivirga litoralis]MBG1232812.1 DoxX family protein [Aestuariivirga litoralis]